MAGSPQSGVPQVRNTVFRKMTHVYSVRVYYEDTDMAGIVYHANYLKFMERARSAWVREMGIDQNQMRQRGLFFAVRHIDADFLIPAAFDDQLNVCTDVQSVSGARLILNQSVMRADEKIFSAAVTLALVGADGKPTRMPEAIQKNAIKWL